jgi:hypothetical protein
MLLLALENPEFLYTWFWKKMKFRKALLTKHCTSKYAPLPVVSKNWSVYNPVSPNSSQCATSVYNTSVHVVVMSHLRPTRVCLREVWWMNSTCWILCRFEEIRTLSFILSLFVRPLPSSYVVFLIFIAYNPEEFLLSFYSESFVFQRDI